MGVAPDIDGNIDMLTGNTKLMPSVIEVLSYEKLMKQKL